MFGIGLPELLVILALGLIVVGPEKLPGLAKTVARQLLELKKAAASLQESLKEEEADKPWEEEFHRNQPIHGLPPVEPSEDEALRHIDQDRIFDEVLPADGAQEKSVDPEQQSDPQ